MPFLDVLVFLTIGVFAGAVGGLLGIGGSTVFIPAATLVFGEDQQVYQASAMVLNAFVATTATIKHARNGLLRRSVLVPTGVAAAILVVVGVALSNRLDGGTLAKLFGILLLLIAVNEVRLLVTARRDGNDETTSEPPRTAGSSAVLGGIGGSMGLMGGLLGIGGGTIGVPLLKVAGRLPLRLAIANAAAVTIPLAIVGAIYKNASLPDLPGQGTRALVHAATIAAVLVPGAVLGSWLGAGLVRRLPLTAIRIAFLGLLLFAGTRMLGLH